MDSPKSSVSNGTPQSADSEICLSLENLALERDSSTVASLSSAPPLSSNNGANSSWNNVSLPPQAQRLDINMYPQLRDKLSRDPQFRIAQRDDLYTNSQFRTAQCNNMQSDMRSMNPLSRSRFQIGESSNFAQTSASEPSVIPDNIWGYQNPHALGYTGDSLLYGQSLGSYMGCQIYANNSNFNNLGYGPNNFAPNMPAAYWCEGKAKLVETGSDSLGMGYGYPRHRLGPPAELNGFYPNNGYYMNRGTESSTGSWDHMNEHVGRLNYKARMLEGDSIKFMEARDEPRQITRQHQKKGDSTKSLGDLIEESNIFELLTDEVNKLYEKLQGCNTHELLMIVKKLTSEHELFIQAAFYHCGSHRIQELIRQLKKLKQTHLASELTSILSTRFYDMLVDKTARHVIDQCVKLLGQQPNEVLYEEAIRYASQLATDKTGCLALSTIVDNIVGPQRERLLYLLAEDSANLANDPAGNYVVQHLLGLFNPLVNREILYQLDGKFRDLSMKKGGSYVVEKCMTCSPEGVIFVVRDLLRTREIHKLAKDQYGNYVVQKALEISKNTQPQVYISLVEALKPHFHELQHASCSRSVIKCIIEGKSKGSKNPKRGQF